MSHHDHQFIFTPGLWLGEGKVSFTASPETLQFYTRWEVRENTAKGIPCIQTVEMQGLGDSVRNAYTFFLEEEGKMRIFLQNEMMEKTIGTGVVSVKSIAWEFRGYDNFEGYEVYELQEDGAYKLHAEYSSPDQFRTIIDGRIWRKQD
ncbi:MAG: hypothetical protein H7A37_05800 [Chlamydiales bacterium]|nr:hypothetical protein [Chlamydiia bacterium]MCP5507794.1 hypothetical protein [Chlamydiales bacterium]